ncbi:MAG TPA: hypothetical protein VF419_03310 [Nitrososphaeraceae archaeon]
MANNSSTIIKKRKGTLIKIENAEKEYFVSSVVEALNGQRYLMQVMEPS